MQTDGILLCLEKKYIENDFTSQHRFYFCVECEMECGATSFSSLFAESMSSSHREEGLYAWGLAAKSPH